MNGRLLAAFCFTLGLGCPAAATDKPAHHTTDGFRNLRSGEGPEFGDLIKWQRERKEKKVPGAADYHFPLAGNDPAYLRANRTDTTLTWIGHTTFLLQVAGKNILTEPQFSDRASPLPFAGPRRVVAPGLALEQLPPIDLVIISHDHYDALDVASVDALATREGGAQTVFAVPLGLKPWFANFGITNVIELDWWQSGMANGMEITAVPAQHWSKRTLFSRNRTLWCGFVVRARDFHFYFVGDSGYSPDFKVIGERFGPIDLAAIPIGAYEPRWFMRAHHMDPVEAVQVHRDVRARRSIGMHWGTFILTDEPLDEPPIRLAQARRAAGLPDDAFRVLRHGETIQLGSNAKRDQR